MVLGATDTFKVCEEGNVMARAVSTRGEIKGLAVTDEESESFRPSAAVVSGSKGFLGGSYDFVGASSTWLPAVPIAAIVSRPSKGVRDGHDGAGQVP